MGCLCGIPFFHERHTFTYKKIGYYNETTRINFSFFLKKSQRELRTNGETTRMFFDEQERMIRTITNNDASNEEQTRMLCTTEDDNNKSYSLPHQELTQSANRDLLKSV